jgi:hypothetical protein
MVSVPELDPKTDGPRCYMDGQRRIVVQNALKTARIVEAVRGSTRIIRTCSLFVFCLSSYFSGPRAVSREDIDDCGALILRCVCWNSTAIQDVTVCAPRMKQRV